MRGTFANVRLKNLMVPGSEGGVTRHLPDGAVMPIYDAAQKYAAHQVPLEMCPLSNVRTGVVAAIDQHPIRRYYERGLKITVSTDDPEMFGNSLADEYRVLVERLGMTASDIRALILNSTDSAWLPEADKSVLRETLLADPTFAASATDLHGKEN